MNDSDIQEVYQAANLQQAHLINHMLAEQGIESRTVGESLLNAVGELPHAAIAPRIWVRRQDADAARQFILQFEAMASDQSEIGQDWICGRCGELNAPQFEICWNCQASRSVE